MTYDVGLKKDLFRGIRLRGYASDGGIVSNEGLVSCNLWTGVLLPERSRKYNNGGERQRGKDIIVLCDRLGHTPAKRNVVYRGSL